MKHEKFAYHSLEDVKKKIKELNVDLPISENVDLLKEEVKIGSYSVPNRLAIQPMEGCDGLTDGTPAELTFRRYDRFAGSGAGLIWSEAVAVVPEGRANPRQLMLTEENLDSFQRMIDRIKEKSTKLFGFTPVLIMQETHSGRYSKPYGKGASMIAYHHPVLEKDRPLPDEAIVTDDYLKSLEEAYAKSAVLAEKAGFDGVDIKACHRYLFSELLSAYEREGEYGGSFENRTRCLRNSIAAAKAAISDKMIVTSRMNIYDGYEYPYGFGVNKTDHLEPDMSEPIALAKRLYDEYGVRLLDLTIGNPYNNPHVNRPYDMGAYEPPEHPFEGLSRMCRCIGEVKKHCSDMVIISSANSYLREFSVNMAAGMVEEKKADIIGFGRMAFAYPEFAKDIVTTGKLDAKQVCLSCSKCTQLMRAQTVAGCVIRDREVYMPIYKKHVLENEEDIIHKVSSI